MSMDKGGGAALVLGPRLQREVPADSEVGWGRLVLQMNDV